MKTYRTFLTPVDQGTDNSFVSVSKCKYSGDNSYDLVLGACHRVVQFSFDGGSGTYKKKRTRQALAKLAKIEKACALIREGLEQ